MYFESNDVEFKREEVTSALVRFSLSSTKWGELGNCWLKMVDQTRTDVNFTEAPPPLLIDAFAYYSKLPKEERISVKTVFDLWRRPILQFKNMKKLARGFDDSGKDKDFPFVAQYYLPNVPPQVFQERYESNMEADNKFVLFILNIACEERARNIKHLHKMYHYHLLDEYHLNEKPITGIDLKKRRGGPIPTPDDEKERVIQEWEKVKGKMTLEAFCQNKNIGVSTLSRWRRDLEIKKKSATNKKKPR